MDRREFLKLAGASLVGTSVFGLSGCTYPQYGNVIPPYVDQPDGIIPGQPVFYATVCRLCEAGCGIAVRTLEGRAHKNEGNPNHPVSLGRLSALGQAGLTRLYNPDRIKNPLRLRGKRGSGDYEAISWDDAVGALAGKLKDAAGARDGVAFLSRPLSGSEGRFVQTLMGALGSGRVLTFESLGRDTYRRAAQVSFGWNTLPHLDIENARYILSFGAEFLGSWLSPVRYGAGYGQFRQGRQGVRGRHVQVEPRMSQTGANADEWVPVRPGTDGLLALGIARVMIDEKLVQSPNLPQPLQAQVTRYSVDDIARMTDVPADRVRGLARDFAAARPGIAIGGSSAVGHTNSLATLVAINALNYLVGSVGQPGGLVFSPDPPVANTPVGQPATLKGVSDLASAISGGAVKAALVYDANPLYSLPAETRFGQAFQSVPFVASFSSFMDETTAQADLILPDHTYLESWGDQVPQPGLPVATVGLLQPVVDPVFDTRQFGDTILAVAKAMGGAQAGAFPWQSYYDFLRENWGGVQKLNRGSVVEPNFDDFWRKALSQGGWWDTQPQGNAPAPAPQGAGLSGLSLDPPKFGGDEKDFPFVLHLYESPALGDGAAANLPWLQEMPDPMTTASWGSWVEINPDVARKMDIVDGDVIEVESPSGKVQAPAYVFPPIRPDVVAMPLGQGHSMYGRYAKGRGVNPLSILSAQTQDGTDGLAWSATRVKIRKTGQKGSLFLFQRLTKEFPLDGTSSPEESR
ncbi:MAG TPA: molybdopterin-dependent oxidoreductase [Chloroflexota bacterium]